MGREEKARDGASAATNDEILDVAVVMPRGSTFGAVLGATAGVGLGGGTTGATGWGVVGGLIGQRVASASKGSYPSIVLAASPKKLHILGRERTGVVGGWKNLHPVAYIERNNLDVKDHHHGTVHVIELTDTTTGTTLEFEQQNIGNLGLKDLLKSLAQTSDG
ncbi:MAG: hypothetical protein ABWY57_10955 [Mycetocola sp.]